MGIDIALLVNIIYCPVLKINPSLKVSALNLLPNN